MCLMLIAYNYHPDYPLILASNRDEFYCRPTEALNVHEEQQDMLCGLDLEGGGTWLAASRSGRIAALTNVREPERHSGNAPSRGLLVKQCVLSDQPLSDCLNTIMQQAESYNGFNLIAADSSGLYYCSNRTATVQKLATGLYGLSNHQLDTAWPKVTTAKALFRDALDAPGALNHEKLFTLLRNNECPPEHLLPDTGVGPYWERILAPIFIDSEIYGTRTSSLILLARDGLLRFIERTHDSARSSDSPGTRDHAFNVQHE
jgi:uncharacterized protein with NRDE domain